VFPIDQLRHIAVAARDRTLALHLDGARLFNAAVASGMPVARWAEPFDTVSICLSKGLGAPVGSLVASTAAIVDRVHRIRKMLGGGMRQAGILAAAGLHALENHVERLAEDHANARRLAAGLEGLGLSVAPAPETNIVLFRVPDTRRFAKAVWERGVRMNPVAEGVFRAVTHLDVTAEGVDEALSRIEAARFW
jgi:threonine aldolase